MKAKIGGIPFDDTTKVELKKHLTYLVTPLNETLIGSQTHIHPLN